MLQLRTKLSKPNKYKYTGPREILMLLEKRVRLGQHCLVCKQNKTYLIFFTNLYKFYPLNVLTLSFV